MKNKREVSKLSLFSPAKINIFLRILSRRSDGFHFLASLMQAVDLGDIITLTLSERDSFTCTNPFLPKDENNLVIKALSCFRKETGIHENLHIHLEKRIPIEAGLGGGSSNVSTLLWGLNTLFSTRIPEKDLMRWSAKISADSPFFFSTGCAYCTGIGEQVESFSPVIPSSEMWLVKPSYGMSTPRIFKHLNLLDCSSISPKHLLWGHVYNSGTPLNDLERVAFRLEPKLHSLKDTLEKQGAQAVWMTGSGTGFVYIGQKPELDSTYQIFPLRWIFREKGHWYNFQSIQQCATSERKSQ